jgi:ferric-dicitrate binding protein FerR (iron transport regulator)
MSDPTQEQEQAFLRRVQSALDEHEGQLDASTLRDLRLARHRALETLQKPRRLWQPVGLAAMAAAVAVVVVALQFLQPKVPDTAPGMEDMALLSAGDEFDLYENLEFYQWLELEKQNG